MTDLRQLTDEELSQRFARVAAQTGPALSTFYQEFDRRARARMLEAQQQMVESQKRVEASQAQAETLTSQTADDTRTLVHLTWAITALTLINVLVFVLSLIIDG